MNLRRALLLGSFLVLAGVANAANTACGSTTYNLGLVSGGNPGGLENSPGCEQVDLNFNNFGSLDNSHAGQTGFGITFAGTSPTGTIAMNVAGSTGGTLTASGGTELSFNALFLTNVDQTNASYLPPAGDQWTVSGIGINPVNAVVPNNAGSGAEVEIYETFCIGGGALSCTQANQGVIYYYLTGSASGPPVVNEGSCLGSVCSSSLTVNLPAGTLATTIGSNFIVEMLSTATATTSIDVASLFFEQQAVPEPASSACVVGGFAALALLKRISRRVASV